MKDIVSTLTKWQDNAAGYTHHKKWTFQPAKVNIHSNSLTENYKLGITDLVAPDLVHYSSGVNVRTYSIEIAERIGTDINRDFLFLDGDCGLCHSLATFMDKRMKKDANIGYRPNTSMTQDVIASMPFEIYRIRYRLLS